MRPAVVLQIVVILWFASRHIPRHEVTIHSCPRSASNVLSEEGYDVVLEPVGEKSCEISCAETIDAAMKSAATARINFFIVLAVIV